MYPWQPAFLAALRVSGTPAHACEAAKVDRRWAYRVRAADAGFAEEWDDALAGYADDLRVEAIRRATKGVQELVLYRGQPVTVWRMPGGTIVPPHTPGATAVPLTRSIYSDASLWRLLQASNPEEFGRRGRAAPVPDPQAVIEQERKRQDETSRAWLRAMTYEELQDELAKLRARSAADLPRS